jgi:ubiquinone/menaquinone biosynthesis C-methylase UbiE
MIFSDEYYKKHEKRFREIESILEFVKLDGRFLELGATEKFQVMLSAKMGADNVFGTIFSADIEHKIRKRLYRIGEQLSENISYNLNLESELFPVNDLYFNTVLCSDVIEHLDVDPMFMLSELNRVITNNGYLIITTPNCTSARNIWKITKGYRPHFFMQYEKSRSPYRRNIEYDVHSIKVLLNSAGFEIETIYTKDVFEETFIEGLKFIESARLYNKDRGDCIFCIARKVGPVTDRWPVELDTRNNLAWLPVS